SASRRLHFFVATKKAKQRKRPLLNRPAGTRLRRYEIQPEAGFHRFRKGIWRHSDGAIAVSSLSKSYKITHKI
ncbi:MAG: hypothetical protein ACJAWL_000001, partial [Motiliproteus sp.]